MNAGTEGILTLSMCARLILPTLLGSKVELIAMQEDKLLLPYIYSFTF